MGDGPSHLPGTRRNQSEGWWDWRTDGSEGQRAEEGGGGVGGGRGEEGSGGCLLSPASYSYDQYPGRIP